ncbi:gamma-glutamyl-gamma-aminobutyrate hydrolase family protein [Nakamurella leprariae]|uniref:Gamma-glutamyl-gamma-aminobutyrate hydrolase family protein n=1 Tax=Nakamurella leprariae TaxID=2803911 RepID=A0A939BVG9_9ACTN|nr:gamma-glutamyl-gamma-aminobutyrate hydrolase family protein [Nakamurella leprariae]MBM9466508.1 gamma-glutamyl-gamma-aminobutyrate hydrolase family protein [Nakamurella leprariae]
MTRPVIGISTYRTHATWSRWQGVEAAVLPAAYVDAVTAGGGTAVLIPPLHPADSAGALLSRLDGLVLAGGSDVNPSRYGRIAHPATHGWHDDRDVSELALLDAAADLDRPVLAICRGMQLLAVHAGGHLHQHVPDVVGHPGHRPENSSYGPVTIRIEPESRLAGILSPPPVTVPCHHHQAVADHPRHRATAWAADGLPEALELPGDRFVVGVQWHPEVSDDRRLFAALVAAARSA